jgi:hypothetical protein
MFLDDVIAICLLSTNSFSGFKAIQTIEFSTGLIIYRAGIGNGDEDVNNTKQKKGTLIISRENQSSTTSQ